MLLYNCAILVVSEIVQSTKESRCSCELAEFDGITKGSVNCGSFFHRPTMATIVLASEQIEMASN